MRKPFTTPTNTPEIIGMTPFKREHMKLFFKISLVAVAVFVLIAWSCVPDKPKRLADKTPVGNGAVVFYTSKSGDKIMRDADDTWGYFVWVEDKDGNIKAVARH